MADDSSSGETGCVDSGASAHYVPYDDFFVSHMVPGTQVPSQAVVYTAGLDPLHGICAGDFVLIDPA